MEAQFPNSGAKKVALVNIRSPFSSNQQLLPFAEVQAMYSRQMTVLGIQGILGKRYKLLYESLSLLQFRIFQNFTVPHTLTYSGISVIITLVPSGANTQLCHLTINWIISKYSFIFLWLARLSPDLNQEVQKHSNRYSNLGHHSLLSPPFCPFSPSLPIPLFPSLSLSLSLPFFIFPKDYVPSSIHGAEVTTVNKTNISSLCENIF